MRAAVPPGEEGTSLRGRRNAMYTSGLWLHGLLLALWGAGSGPSRIRRPALPAPGRRSVLSASSLNRGRNVNDKTILVVDDNRDNVEILRAFLESKGYVVAEAPDGRTALAKLEQVRPALVLLDVMMPGMDGWQVCRTIKNHPDFGRTRVVMVTAKGGFEDKFEGLRSGADDYVVKPVDLKELANKVERNLAAWGAGT